MVVAATLSLSLTRRSCYTSTPTHPKPKPKPKPNQAELLRLEPALVSSLPSPAEPVLRSIHACFVAARLLRLG